MLLLCLYDDYGNVLKTMVGSQALSTNTYAEKNGALTTTTYGNGDKRTYNYNKLGLVSSIVSINDGTSKTSYSWGYNDSGRTMYHRDAENNLKYLYDYDSLGRLIRQEIQTNDTFSHVGSTEVAYDVRNNVTKIASEFGGYTATDEYMYSSNSGSLGAETYAKDNLISRYRIAGSRTVDYYYDDLNRLIDKDLNLKNVAILTSYSYADSKYGGKYTTTQLASEALDNITYSYYYDNVGNITRIRTSDTLDDTTINENYRKYEYDSKNQLTKEVNATTGITTTFTYDAIGNITKKVQSSTSGTKTINYRYGNDGKTGWNNLLTGVDLSGNGAYESNETISYDAIGNPTTYFGATLSWYGRQLKSYSVNGTTVNYTYDADGLRTSLSIPGLNCTYQYVGGQLRYETRGDHKFYYFYDASGNLSAIRYYDANGKSYAYFALTNAQGDVVAFYTGSGKCVVTYEYDAWGNVVKQTDTSGINFAELNLIRYRGYYYDSSIGLYYLQSRYYNPKIGRFLNADVTLNGNGDVLGYNMFAYCSNNPVNRIDLNGCSWSEFKSFCSNTWNKVKKWVNNTFGFGTSTTTTIIDSKVQIIPPPSPLTIENGVSTSTSVKSGNSDKPISFYTEKDTENLIFSSSAGVKLNFLNHNLNISLGLDNTALTFAHTKNNVTNSIGVRANLSQFKIGIEARNEIEWDSFTESQYTNVSIDATGIVMLYAVATGSYQGTGNGYPIPGYGY